MKRVFVASLMLLFPLIAACSRTPGPAERMGRGLDEILEGGKEMQDKYGNTSETQAQEDEDPRTREERLRDSREDLDSDEWWREHDRLMQLEPH